jgi:hypothetical protein
MIFDAFRLPPPDSAPKAPLTITNEFGMRSLPTNAAEDFLEIIHRRHWRGTTIIATNRPVEDWGRILGDNAATSAIRTASSTKPRSSPSKESPTGRAENESPKQAVVNFLPDRQVNHFQVSGDRQTSPPIKKPCRIC